MGPNAPVHPGARSKSGRYLSSEDGTVQVPALIALPSAFRHVLSDLETYKWKTGDFMLNTYPKNGTYFVWEIMSMLLKGSADYIETPKQLLVIDLFPVSKIEDTVPSPRVLQSHYRPDVLIPEFRKNKTVIVIRNPKDVCISLYHHERTVMANIIESYEPLRDLSLSDWVRMFLYDKDVPYGNYFDYTAYVWSLREDPTVLVLFFEDFKINPVETIAKLNNFMETERSMELVQQIADATEFEKMKKGKIEHCKDLGVKMAAQTGQPEDETKQKAQLIINNLYRKGTIGDWKNQLTVADNELFNSFLESWEEGKDIPFLYE
ncbi:sulfotransferase 1C2A-like isoform X2 [Watersipora subatra]